LLDGLPLDYGDWAADPYFLKVLVQLIHRHKPKNILECGSGTSTVLVSQTQGQVSPSGSVTALEHLPEFAEKSRWLVKEHGLQKQATIVEAPLQEWTVDGKQVSWYGIELARFGNQKIDMLIVDGPPNSTGPAARYPAAFVLQEYLANDCVIIMDDGDRPNEEYAAHQWADLLGAEIEYMGGPNGTYVLRC
jgi:predicted O-methyltransferase YrrM